MPLLQFKQCGKLESYERARAFGRLQTFDTWDLALDFAKKNTIVFFSHEWCEEQIPAKFTHTLRHALLGSHTHVGFLLLVLPRPGSHGTNLILRTSNTGVYVLDHYLCSLF